MEERIISQEEANLRAVEDYRSLVGNQGWNRFQARLVQLLNQKEQVKAAAIRADKVNEIRLNQGFIDALNFVISEPLKLISRMTNPAGENNEQE